MVPKSLRHWFVFHCISDVAFALPLLILPVRFLTMLGWEAVDPFASRLGAAALMGIGIESYLGRNAGPEAYRSMLNLEVIWAATALVGMAVTMSSGRGPWAAWSFIAIFAAFNIVWVTYRLRLRRLRLSAPPRRGADAVVYGGAASADPAELLERAGGGGTWR
jgi:hypothetical protein